MRPSNLTLTIYYHIPLRLLGPVTPCPLSLPHLLAPRILTLPPFLTPLWKVINGGQNKTLPSIQSFPGFNPVILLRLSSPLFESKSLHSASPRTTTTNSRNGSPRL